VISFVNLFSCYEAFIHIIDSMFNQHAKFLKASKTIGWRRPIASLNYLLTSHVWRQDQYAYCGIVEVPKDQRRNVRHQIWKYVAVARLKISKHVNLRSRALQTQHSYDKRSNRKRK